jgi:hypothetical protein
LKHNCKKKENKRIGGDIDSILGNTDIVKGENSKRSHKAKERKDNETALGEECVGWGDKNNAREGVREGDDKDDYIQLLIPAWAPFGHRQ